MRQSPADVIDWTKRCIVELIQSVIDDVNKGRIFAYLTCGWRIVISPATEACNIVASCRRIVVYRCASSKLRAPLNSIT
jgi:hypothetical protein